MMGLGQRTGREGIGRQRDEHRQREGRAPRVGIAPRAPARDGKRGERGREHGELRRDHGQQRRAQLAARLQGGLEGGGLARAEALAQPHRDLAEPFRAQRVARLDEEGLAPCIGEHRGRHLERPLEVASAMLANAWRQSFLVEPGDTLGAEWLGQVAVRLREGFGAREAAAFEASLQARGELRAALLPMVPPQLPVLAASLAALAVAGWRARRDADARRPALALAVLVALAANAFATGALSKPHHRYQARIAWLVPVAAALLLLPARQAAPVRQVETGAARATSSSRWNPFSSKRSPRSPASSRPMPAGRAPSSSRSASSNRWPS